MKKIIKVFMFIFSSIHISGQILVQIPSCDDIDTIGNMHYKEVWANPLGPSRVFDSLDYIKFYNLDRKLDTVLASLNYMDQVNKYLLGRYHLQQEHKEKAIIIFKGIMRFPFWSQYEDIYIDKWKTQTYSQSFFEIYWKSGHYLIEALAGNLEELNKLDFVPASYGHLMVRLRLAVEKAGGQWTRGDYYVPMQDNDIKNLEKHNKNSKNEK